MFYIKNISEDTFKPAPKGFDYSQGLPDNFDMIKEDGALVPANNQILYCLVEVNKNPTHDSNIQKVIEKEPVYSDTQHPTYPHAKQCVREWEVMDLEKEVMLNKLLNKYVTHKEQEYPAHLRERHKDQRDDLLFQMILGIIGHLELSLTDILSPKTLTLVQELIAIGNWQEQISLEYEDQNANLDDNDITPTFKFTDKP